MRNPQQQQHAFRCLQMIEMEVILKILKNVLDILIQLAGKNYFFAKNFYKYQHRRQFKNTSASPIIIYQMGKVGSKTIRVSLKSLGLENPIYHSHILTADRNVESENKRRKFFRTNRHAYLQRPWLNQFL